MAESPLELAVIVPATNRPPHLSACIAAIEAADEGPEELIVVREPAGAGPARARNDGASRASAPVIVFVDADVLVHADVFVRIRSWFAENPGLTAVFGAYDDEPSAAGVVSQFRNLLHHHVHEQGRGRAATFWTGLGAIRRDAFARSGGFDAARFSAPSIEDVELGARLHAGGAWIELDPSIRATHLKAWTMTDMVRTDFLHRGLPWSRLLLSGETRPHGLNLGTRHRLTALAAATLVGGALARRRDTAARASLAILALNWRFYRLVARRAGARAGVTAPALHVVHHLVGLGAFLTAAAERLSKRLRG